MIGFLIGDKMIKQIINFFSKEEQKDETFETVFQPIVKDHHIVRIETTGQITERTARDHAQLASLFGAFDFKDDFKIGFSNFEIHQFVSEELILQVEIKKLEK